MPGKVKIVIRHSLWIDSDAGLNPCGTRLYRGDKKAIFPKELQADNGAMITTFDTIPEAEKAGRLLEDYIKKTT